MLSKKLKIDNQKKVVGYSTVRTGINLLHIGLTFFIVCLIIYVWINHKKIFKKLLESMLDTVESKKERIQTIIDKHIKKSFESIDDKLQTIKTDITTDITKTMDEQTKKMDETLEKRQNQQPTQPTQPTQPAQPQS